MPFLPVLAWPKGRIELTLFPKRPVAGRDTVVEVVVTNKDGSPIEDAVVRLIGRTSGMGVEVEGRTKEKGRVKLPLPAKRGGLLTVEVVAIGYEPKRLDVFLKFSRLPPSAVIVSLLGILSLWGGLAFCLRKAFPVEVQRVK